MTWQLSTGQSDYQWLMNVITKYKQGKLTEFKYAKGSANMRYEPKEGDEVYVTCRAKLLLKGKIQYTFTWEYNPNVKVYEKYATIKITEVIDDKRYMKGQRRNWTKIKENECVLNDEI